MIPVWFKFNENWFEFLDPIALCICYVFNNNFIIIYFGIKHFLFAEYFGHGGFMLHILLFIIVLIEAISPKMHWYSAWNSIICCNFLFFLSDQLLLSLLISVSVLSVLRSVSYPLSSSSTIRGEEDPAPMD